MVAALTFLGCTKSDNDVAAKEPAPECQIVDAEGPVVEAANSYFRKEVGAVVTSSEVQSIERCGARWNVLISAVTEGHSMPRLWYVELSRPDLRPLAFVRPE